MLQRKNIVSQPFGLSELCFERNEFLKGDFSVDSFLHLHRNAGSLESMRDDLGIYMKILRSAMIELINEDYGDFVNLSANLVGLDEFIQSICKKLKCLETDILTIKSVLDNNLTKIKKHLGTKRLLRIYKINLWSLANVYKSTHRLSKLQTHMEANPDSAVLERAAMEYIKLKVHLQTCDKYVENSQRRQEQELYKLLQEKLKTYFINALHVNNENLEWCLKIYSALDEYHIAENIVREEIVGNYMSKIISETAMQNSPQGLASIYSHILDFIPLHMKGLLQIDHSVNNGNFNFILNSFWRDVGDRMETQMPSIFAPGNPDLFFVNYTATQNFWSKIETILGSNRLISNFHRSDQYRSFDRRWNLPVYFQIRFQEIAGCLENACNQSVEDGVWNVASNAKTIKTALNCITRCWDSGVYINKLFPRFLKLTLQILSRLTHWISEGLQVIISKSTEFDKVKVLVSLYCDLVTFRDQLPNILKIIQNNLPKEIVPHSTVLEKCVEESEKEFDLKLTEIDNIITEQVSTEISFHVRSVSDIPRLFRKTNRDTPNKPCLYIEQMANSTRQFYDNYVNKLGEGKTKGILLLVFSSITSRYYAAVAGVLTSVQKTEESLRRLKNLRDKSAMNPPTISDRCTLSDDDKIRMQLQIDALFWIDTIRKFDINELDINNLTHLMNLFEDFSKIKINNK